MRYWSDSTWMAPPFRASATKPWGAFRTPKIFALLNAVLLHLTPARLALRRSALVNVAAERSAPPRSVPTRSASVRSAPAKFTDRRVQFRKLVPRKLASERSAKGKSQSRRSAVLKLERTSLACPRWMPCKNAPETSTPTRGTPSTNAGWPAFGPTKVQDVSCAIAVSCVGADLLAHDLIPWRARSKKNHREWRKPERNSSRSRRARRAGLWRMTPCSSKRLSSTTR